MFSLVLFPFAHAKPNKPSLNVFRIVNKINTCLPVNGVFCCDTEMGHEGFSGERHVPATLPKN